MYRPEIDKPQRDRCYTCKGTGRRENMPNCRNCTHCGPDSGTTPIKATVLIRCNHPDWGDEETEMREIDPAFGEECADYSRQNA